MAAVLHFSSLAWPLLHIGDLRFIEPAESHHLFGAGFLFIGAVMALEGLSGRVWHRSRLRTVTFPAILVLLGWGLIFVSAVEPRARVVHFSMAFPMIAGGWAEARSRLEDFPRKYADVFIVAGIGAAGLETLLFHLTGPAPVVAVHVSLVVVAVAVAGLRLYQSARQQSLARSLLLSGAVMALGAATWVDAFFQ